MTDTLVMRLRWLCSPSAESLSDHHRITGFIREGYEAADEIERLTRERDAAQRQLQMLQEAARPLTMLIAALAETEKTK